MKYSNAIIFIILLLVFLVVMCGGGAWLGESGFSIEPL